MITFIHNGDIFDSKCQTLVNTINCVGVMGKGLALEMKKRYPVMYDSYRQLCRGMKIDIGKLWLWKRERDHWILNFPTKFDWRRDSRIDYIEIGLNKFVETYREKGITSIAFPMLGCNNGGLKVDDVKELMLHYLIDCDDLYIEIYYPPVHSHT